MRTVDDHSIDDRLEKGDVGDGFVSTAENKTAEVRPSAVSSRGW